MLGAVLFDLMREQYERTIDTLGVPMQWTNTKTNTTKSVVGGMKIATDADLALVQSYGVGARVITIKAAGLTTEPEKFDRFAVQGAIYVAESVAPVHLNGTLVGFRIYIKGR